MANKITVYQAPDRQIVRFSRRNPVLGVLLALLATNETVAAVFHGTELIAQFTGPALLSLTFRSAAAVIFALWCLEFTVVERRLEVSPEGFALWAYWPLPLFVQRWKKDRIAKVVVSTLFSHLTKKATLYVSFVDKDGRRLGFNAPVLRVELNSAVDRVARALEALGCEVVVMNENTLE